MVDARTSPDAGAMILGVKIEAKNVRTYVEFLWIYPTGGVLLGTEISLFMSFDEVTLQPFLEEDGDRWMG